MVPAINGNADAVQVTAVIGMVSVPEVRSVPARAVRVAVDAFAVRTFAVTVTGELAVMLGVVAGLASAKLIVAGASVNSARAATVALMVRV